MDSNGGVERVSNRHDPNGDKLYAVMVIDTNGVRFFLSDFNGMDKNAQPQVHKRRKADALIVEQSRLLKPGEALELIEMPEPVKRVRLPEVVVEDFEVVA